MSDSEQRLADFARRATESPLEANFAPLGETFKELAAAYLARAEQLGELEKTHAAELLAVATREDVLKQQLRELREAVRDFLDDPGWTNEKIDRLEDLSRSEEA